MRRTRKWILFSSRSRLLHRAVDEAASPKVPCRSELQPELAVTYSQRCVLLPSLLGLPFLLTQAPWLHLSTQGWARAPLLPLPGNGLDPGRRCGISTCWVQGSWRISKEKYPRTEIQKVGIFRPQLIPFTARSPVLARIRILWAII